MIHNRDRTANKSEKTKRTEVPDRKKKKEGGKDTQNSLLFFLNVAGDSFADSSASLRVEVCQIDWFSLS